LLQVKNIEIIQKAKTVEVPGAETVEKKKKQEKRKSKGSIRGEKVGRKDRPWGYFPV